MYKAIKKFAVQDALSQSLIWYDVGEEVDDKAISRLSSHSLSYLVEEVKPNGKGKKQSQRKGRKQSRKD